jgi:dienelactone hydrolase
MTQPQREDVEFTSNGATLRGWLYPAATAAPAAAVVMTHGLSGVKEMFLDDYAAAFAAAGFTTLAFDNFGFGASDGEPRQSPAPDLLLQGYRDGVAWIARRPGVDASRIGLWGSSLSGGIVISLAAETIGIACAVAQVPNFGDGGAAVPAGLIEEFGRIAERADVDATVPAVTDSADGVGVMYEDGAHEWFTRVAAERAPSWRNELLAAGIAALGAHRPVDDLPKARVPLLLIVAPDDHLTPPGPGQRIAAAAPNVEVVEIPGNHFSAYEAEFAASSQPAIDWFDRHLGA